jgi:uncharacterized RDD family membrane protein YckC
MDLPANTEQHSSNAIEQAVTVIGFGRRLAAMLIDGLLIALLTFILVVAVAFLAVLAASFSQRDQPPPVGRLIVLCGALISVVYYVRYWSKSGQTVGKSMLGIKVVSTDGSRVSTGKAVLRYIGYLVSGIVLSLGFLWVAYDRKRQGWHDKIAGTYVIDIDDQFGPADQVKFVPSDPERRWIWLVLWLVLALLVPAALLGSLLLLLGPSAGRALMNILQSLF